MRRNVSYSKGLHTKGGEVAHAPAGWCRRFPGAATRRSHSPRARKSSRGAAREHSVFGRHNANASIILDDRRLISYCREGRRARSGIISGRDVASRSKFRNFAK